MRSQGKSLTQQQNKRARAMLTELIQSRFSGHKTKAARAFGVSQACVSDFLNGRRGAGNKLVGGVAKIDPATAAAMINVDVGAEALPVGSSGAIAMLMQDGLDADAATRLAIAAAALSVGTADAATLYRVASAMGAVARAVIGLPAPERKDGS